MEMEGDVHGSAVVLLLQEGGSHRGQRLGRSPVTYSQWPGLAGCRAFTQNLRADYLPKASFPLAGSRSQSTGFYFLKIFPQPFLGSWFGNCKGLRITRPGSPLPLLLGEKMDAAFQEGTLTLNVHDL